MNEEEALGVLRGDDPVGAAKAANVLWALWHRSGDPQLDSILRQGIEAMEKQDLDAAQAIFTKLIGIAPGFAEGWNKRATVRYMAQDYPGDGYDFACIFDALHDMGDPVGAASHIRSTLKPDGTFMLVEPIAGDSMAENMHPIGQIFYAFSTTVCTPASLAQPVGLGLGAQAGQKRLTEVLEEAGFTKVRRAAETPTNMVLEVTG